MKKERIDLSREKLVNAFYLALGSYIEQEAKKEDQWVDQTIGQLYAHLKHELEEIKTSMAMNNMTFLLHNAIDAVMLSVILLTKVMDMARLNNDQFETK